MEQVCLQIVHHQGALGLALPSHPQPAIGCGIWELRGHKDATRQACTSPATSCVWPHYVPTHWLSQVWSAGSLTACENGAPDHSSGLGVQSWLCPWLAMSFAHVLASADCCLPMAIMRWAGSSLEAASSFDSLGSRVDLQSRVGHLLQVWLSQKW